MTATQQLTALHEITAPMEPNILEAAGDPSGGHTVEVTIIRSGTSTNGNHYPEPLLRESAPHFDGARAFADHAGPHMNGQPRSVRDLVGHYRNPRYELTPAGGRIRADLHVLPGQDWLWGIIQEAQAHPDICGLSIDAKGEVKMAEVGGKKVRVVEAFRAVNSIDVVSKPAAGGSLDRIIAGEENDACPTCDGTGSIPELETRNQKPETCPVCNGSGYLTEASDKGNGIADERPVMELDAAQRKQWATVTRHHAGGRVEYKFPIPPKGHPAAESHARNALARLDQSDLTDEEKATVTAKAHAILGTKHHTTKEGTMTATAEAPEVLTEAAVAETRNEKPETRNQPDLGAQLKELLAEKESAARELAQIKEALAPSPSTPTDPTASTIQLLEQIKHDRDVEKSARLMESQLRDSKLPQPIQRRLRGRYDGRVFTAEQLREDIAEEREVLGQLSASGQVSGHGYEKPLTAGMSEYEQLQAAFDKMFDVTESESARSVPSLGGIRQAFQIATGVDIAAIGGVDRPLQESYATGLRNYVQAHVADGSLKEAEYLLREADVTTSTFSYLLGTSMNKRLLKDYQAWPSEWMKFTNVVAIKDFKQQDRIRLGAFGSLSTVAEDAAYTTLTLADTHATYTPSKRGNLVQITRETIINDDLYAIKQIPQKLAVSAAFTLAEFVYEMFDPAGGNIYDAHKLFDSSNHGNTGIASGSIGTANSGAAFSSAALQTATIAMRKQQNAASKPIGLKPRFVLVPPDLEFTAMVILKSAGLPGGSNNDVNPMMGYAEPIVAPQLNSFTTLGATTTFAAVVADPRVIDTLEVGFVGGQVNPVLFIQDQPLYGLNFTQDVISYKVRHEYGGAVVDYRGFYLINN